MLNFQAWLEKMQLFLGHFILMQMKFLSMRSQGEGGAGVSVSLCLSSVFPLWITDAPLSGMLHAPLSRASPWLCSKAFSESSLSRHE